MDDIRTPQEKRRDFFRRPMTELAQIAETALLLGVVGIWMLFESKAKRLARHAAVEEYYQNLNRPPK